MISFDSFFAQVLARITLTSKHFSGEFGAICSLATAR
jgi:hypothetical protein